MGIGYNVGVDVYYSYVHTRVYFVVTCNDMEMRRGRECHAKRYASRLESYSLHQTRKENPLASGRSYRFNLVDVERVFPVTLILFTRVWVELVIFYQV